ncbi:MAG TPA: type IV secretory system conjugative DNA transfer family protein [Acidimicrobiales bacterium]|nr:type IV secretory system conjugative DNA transfer family protein [Acidimicrobiales bacterium]
MCSFCSCSMCVARVSRSRTDNVLWKILHKDINIACMEHALGPQSEVPNAFMNSTRALHEVHRLAGHSIYLGTGPGGWAWAGAQRSTLVLGPSRSGKTSSLVIPNLLLSDGPVVSTSTKPDVLRATASSRCREGWAFLYDPSGEIECPKGVERIGWSPLTTAANWDSAVQTADSMVGASRLSGGSLSLSSGEQHWTERAGALLAPLLHAAASENLPMRSILRWIDRRNGVTPLEILTSTVGEDATATDLLAGIVATDAREQSGIWSTASGVLAAYRTEGAMASTMDPPLNLDEFCRGPNTMYICSPGRRQHQFAPLVVASIGDVRDATYVREREGASGAPTLFALDEVANIAPIPDLVSMVSEGAGQGLLVLACLQDLSQARVRWGTAADGFLSLFGTTVVMPGIADTATLRDLSALGGEHEVTTTTVGRSVGERGRIRPSSSVGTVRLARHPVDVISRGCDGQALVLGPDKTIGTVTLTPSHLHGPWRDLMPVVRSVPARRPMDRGR